MRIAKVLLLGDIGVGKTSLARRLVFDMFEGTYKATIGTDVYRYEVIPSPLPMPFHFIIWDTDGNFADTIFRHVYAKRSDAAVVIADGTRGTSLEAAAVRARGFMEAFPGRPASIVINKLDLMAEKEPVIAEEVRFLDIPVVFTSAKTGHHVQKAFHDAAVTIARRG